MTDEVLNIIDKAADKVYEDTKKISYNDLVYGINYNLVFMFTENEYELYKYKLGITKDREEFLGYKDNLKVYKCLGDLIFVGNVEERLKSTISKTVNNDGKRN